MFLGFVFIDLFWTITEVFIDWFNKGSGGVNCYIINYLIAFAFLVSYEMTLPKKSVDEPLFSSGAKYNAALYS